MKTKTLIIIGTIIVVISGLIAVFVISIVSRTDLDENIIEIPNYPASLEYGARVISVEDDGGGNVIVTNIVDKYQITLSKDWSIPEAATRGSGIEFTYIPNTDLRMSVVVSKATIDISLEDWVGRSTIFNNLEPQKIETTEGESYKASGKVYVDDLDEEGNPTEIPLTNSGIIAYALKENNNFYAISCVVLSENYEFLIAECDKQAKTFKIINKSPLSEYVPFENVNFNIERAGTNEKTGDTKYTIIIKPQSNPGDDGFKKEIEAIVESVNNWIESKGVDPDSLSIEWVTE